MYNHTDIYSKCSALCKAKNINSQFKLGNVHSQMYNIHSCECTLSSESSKESSKETNKQSIKEQFGNNNNNDNNINYSDRNYIEQQNESRLKKLIFG
jgi:hypothetical protein